MNILPSTDGSPIPGSLHTIVKNRSATTHYRHILEVCTGYKTATTHYSASKHVS